MCARALNELSFDDTRQTTGRDVIITSSGEFPRRRPRRGIPPAWRYSLPPTLTNSISTVRQPAESTLPTVVSSSGCTDNTEPAYGVSRRRSNMPKTGKRNVIAAVADGSQPRVRPTCLRYSYWLTLDNDRRRYAANRYSTSPFSGYENQPTMRHFRPRSCEIADDDNRDLTIAACCHVANSSGNSVQLVTNQDAVVRRHLVTESSSASGQAISSSTSALDRTSRTCSNSSTVRIKTDEVDRGRLVGRVNSCSDFSRSHDHEVKGQGQRRLSLSKIGDSGLGTSIHSEQNSPEETNTSLEDNQHHNHHYQEQQQQQELCHQRLSDYDVKNDDDDDDDVNECLEGQTPERQGHYEGRVQRRIDGEHDDDEDDRTKLTRHKRESF